MTRTELLFSSSRTELSNSNRVEKHRRTRNANRNKFVFPFSKWTQLLHQIFKGMLQNIRESSFFFVCFSHAITRRSFTPQLRSYFWRHRKRKQKVTDWLVVIFLWPSFQTKMQLNIERHPDLNRGTERNLHVSGFLADWNASNFVLVLYLFNFCVEPKYR